MIALLQRCFSETVPFLIHKDNPAIGIVILSGFVAFGITLGLYLYISWRFYHG